MLPALSVSLCVSLCLCVSLPLAQPNTRTDVLAYVLSRYLPAAYVLPAACCLLPAACCLCAVPLPARCLLPAAVYVCMCLGWGRRSRGRLISRSVPIPSYASRGCSTAYRTWCETPPPPPPLFYTLSFKQIVLPRQARDNASIVSSISLRKTASLCMIILFCDVM
jgi:hypothetical protein